MAATSNAARHSRLEVLLVALRLGLTSFGGPIAHLGYFHAEYVERRRWLSERAYVDLVALCQVLPGPASSQVGIGVGMLRAGPLGGIAAWVGFTLPSAVLLVAFAYGIDAFDLTDVGFVRGLKVAAVAVVALAVWTMAQRLAHGRIRGSIAVGAALAVLAWLHPVAQLGAIAGGAAVGAVLLRDEASSDDAETLRSPLGRRWGIAAAVTFAALLVALPVAAQITERGTIEVVDAFYRTGSLVFGGGHVVLPLIEREVVPPGWITESDFLAGYGAAQAVPGPLFAFSAFLGASFEGAPGGLGGAALALIAIYVPSFLLLIAVLPVWTRVRAASRFRAALEGVSAAVVGLLAAALYTPLWTTAILGEREFGLALGTFALLVVWRAPPWLAVLFAAAGGQLLL
jgi:chromate transporter